MAFVVADRVQETCTSPGTGTVTLQGAATGYQAFSAGIGNGNVTFYAIADQGGSNWEVGIGTYTSSGNTLSRTTVLASSNGGSLTNFSSGIQNVWCDYPAGKAIYIDPNGDISNAIRNISGITGAITFPDYIGFDVNPSAIPTAPGSLYWDSADGNQTLNLVMAGGTATQQIGEEQYYRVKASSAITNGQVVMFTGTVGASGALTAAPATGLTAETASYVMGIATQDIALNGWGYITSFGLVRNINTNAFAAGSILYLDPTVAGGLTTTVPSAPNPKVQVCACVYQSATVGSLFVRPSFGGILGQYEGDVNISSPANGNLLIRNQTSGKWVNALLGAGTGIAVTNGAGTISVALATAYGDSLNPYGNKTANYVLAGPSSGAAAAPTFRALVAADMPASVDQFPSGTRLLFQQTAAPTGWTKDTTYNNYALRIVNGTVGTGGSVAFTTAFASQTPSGSVAVSGGSVSATTLTSAQIPGHTHNVGGYTGTVTSDHNHNFSVSGNTNLVTSYPAGQSNTNGAQTAGNTNGTQVYFSGSGTTAGANQNHQHYFSATTDTGTPGGGSHTHGFTTPTASFTGNAINLAVQYVDSIIASKN